MTGFQAIAVLLVLLNVLVSALIAREPTLGLRQRRLRLAVVWLLPLLGVVVAMWDARAVDGGLIQRPRRRAG